MPFSLVDIAAPQVNVKFDEAALAPDRVAETMRLFQDEINRQNAESMGLFIELFGTGLDIDGDLTVSGSVGIGTDSPDQILHLFAQDAKLKIGNSNSAIIIDHDNGHIIFKIKTSPNAVSNQGFRFQDEDGTEVFTIQGGNALLKGAIVTNTYNYGAESGAADAYVMTMDPIPAAYVTGMQITFIAGAANTGASTVNVNSLGAKALKRGVSTDPGADYIKAGSVVVAVYDGTNFQMIQPAAQ
jgi:hypothetical protein